MAIIRKQTTTSVGKKVRMYKGTATLENSLATYLFPIVTIKITTNLVASNKIFSYSSGGQKFMIRFTGLKAGLAPPGGSKGRLGLLLLFSFWWGHLRSLACDPLFPSSKHNMLISASVVLSHSALTCPSSLL